MTKKPSKLFTKGNKNSIVNKVVAVVEDEVDIVPVRIEKLEEVDNNDE